jgi:hypothetical protein
MFFGFIFLAGLLIESGDRAKRLPSPECSCSRKLSEFGIETSGDVIAVACMETIKLGQASSPGLLRILSAARHSSTACLRLIKKWQQQNIANPWCSAAISGARMALPSNRACGKDRAMSISTSASFRGATRAMRPHQPGDNPLRDAHARLDRAVRAAYGMAEDVDPLAFLLKLNLVCAAKEKAGKKITPPGLPLPVEEQQAFVTEDCIDAISTVAPMH